MFLLAIVSKYLSKTVFVELNHCLLGRIEVTEVPILLNFKMKLIYCKRKTHLLLSLPIAVRLIQGMLLLVTISSSHKRIQVYDLHIIDAKFFKRKNLHYSLFSTASCIL